MEGKPIVDQIVISKDIFNSKTKFKIEDVIGRSSSLWQVRFRSLKDTEDVRDILINKIKLRQLKLLKAEKFSGNPELVILGLQARLIRLFQYTDPIIETSVSFDPLPHQELAVLQMLELLPIRFMLADEAGAGKTIMAGMLFKQLKARKQAERTLIIVPPILLNKWKREMDTKFNETFHIMNSSYIRSNAADAWQVGRSFKAIASVDLLKREEIRETLRMVKWDLVIVDEAHKLTAKIIERPNRPDEIIKTARYRLGEVISEQADNLLLMTATPHRGEQDVFSFLMSLLDPLAMEHVNAAQMQELIHAHSRLSRHRFLRRMKEQMVTREGKKLFPPRKTQTLTFSLSKYDPLSYELYEEINDYISNVYGKGIQTQDQKIRAVIGFVKQIFQRRLASSTYAVYKSLERRLEKVKDFLVNFENSTAEELELSDEEIDSFEDLPEEDRELAENCYTSKIIVLNKEYLEEEKRVLEKLIIKCDRVLNESDDPKIDELKEALDTYPNSKIVIFTEYKDTLDYIRRRLNGYTSVFIDGSVKFKDRTSIMNEFWIPLSEGGPRIMIGTDAAGEGIDLQIATVLINYDIPWNPNRLEQRMGRIHRIGQEYPVLFINIVAADTREGQVLATLLRKLNLIAQTIGEDKVFDVISDLISEKTIAQLMRKAMDGRSLTEINAELENEITVNQENINREELSIAGLDYEIHFKQLEKRLTPEYTQSFLYKTMKYLEAEIRQNEVGFEINTLPKKFIHHPDFVDIKLPLTINLRNKRRSTSNIEEKQINLTSQSFSTLLEHMQEISSMDIQNGTYLFDPYSKEAYVLWFFEIAIVKNKKDIDRRIIAFKSIDKISEYDPRGIINLRVGSKSDFDNLDLDKYSDLINENIKTQIWETLDIYSQKYRNDFEKPLNELWDARLLAVKQKKKYFSNLVFKNRTKEFRRKAAQEKYDKSKQELKKMEKDKELDVRMNLDMPTLLSKVIVLPKIQDNPVNVDVENLAMQYALKYEKEKGRLPIDVSMMGRGCDIESSPQNDIGNTRYIEVKGRCPGVQVMLEETELIKAERFGDRYWLYLYIFHDEDNVEFVKVQNPVEKLPLKQIIRKSCSITEIKKAAKRRVSNV